MGELCALWLSPKHPPSRCSPPPPGESASPLPTLAALLQQRLVVRRSGATDPAVPRPRGTCCDAESGVATPGEVATPEETLSRLPFRCRDISGSRDSGGDIVAISLAVSRRPGKLRLRRGRCREIPGGVSISAEVATMSSRFVATSAPVSRDLGGLRHRSRRCRDIRQGRDAALDAVATSSSLSRDSSAAPH